ncbi:MAG: type II secretion system F family protein [Candidatus Xenobiia bacterium LiM19]
MLRLNLKEQALFFNQMATLMKAGVPITKSIESIGKNAPSRTVKAFANSISEFVIQGKPFSDALERLPGISDHYIFNLVRVGEQVGLVDVKFREIAEYLERIYSFRMNLITQMIYPLIIIHASILLPPLFYLFTGHVDTYLRLTLTVLIPAYAIVIVGAVMYITMTDSPGIRRFFDSVMAHLPLISGLVLKTAVARFTRALATLYDAGAGLSYGIGVAAKACGNTFLAVRFESMTLNIDKGIPLTESFTKTGLFPPIALQLISTGEDTGELSKTLYKTADYLDEQLAESLKRFFAIIPIFFILVLGIYVGYVFIQFFSSIYKGTVIPDGL